MKRTLFAAIGLLLFALSGSQLFATPTTIIDNYYGYGANGDIVGSDDFSISKMVVDFSGGNLNVDIYTNYVNHVGELGTSLGDLFISTDGWKPFGSGNDHYKNDGWYNNQNHGENWDYALVLGGNGIASLYQIDPKNIIFSHAFENYSYRRGQEVEYAPRDQSSLATGNWSKHEGYLEFTLEDYAEYLGKSSGDFGFKWGMTCANDTIEGVVSAPVPEPGSLILLGTGIAAIGVAVRRKRK